MYYIISLQLYTGSRHSRFSYNHVIPLKKGIHTKQTCLQQAGWIPAGVYPARRGGNDVV